MKPSTPRLGLIGALAGLALSGASAASAADWRVANLVMGDEGRRVVYVDADSLKENKGKIRFRSEEHRQHETDGYDTISQVAVVDCESMDLTVLRATYSRAGAPVAFVSVPQEGNFYSSSSATHWLLQRICSHDFIKGSVANRAEDSTRLFAQQWTAVPSSLGFTTKELVRDRALASAALPESAGPGR